MNLDKLYKKQAELDKHIIEKHNIKMSKEELLENAILALLVEVGELANTTRCFKHWSTKGMMEKEVVLEELADVLHFYLSIGNQMGIQMIEKLLPSKVRINQVLEKARMEQVFIVLQGRISDLYMFGYYEDTYLKIMDEIYFLVSFLNFTDKEVEQAYLKKHEENYRRQREGY